MLANILTNQYISLGIVNRTRKTVYGVVFYPIDIKFKNLYLYKTNTT